MKIRPYVHKLETSKEFKNFKNKYPNSFMTAGFFILDFETGKNVHQVNFYVPSEKKIAAFTLDQGITFQLLNMVNNNIIPEELDINTNIDLDALQGILADEMHNRGMSEEIRKIIAVIQCHKGKKIWSLNCVLSGMEILNSHVEDDTKTVLRIDKTSLMDIMRRIPNNKIGSDQAKENPKDELKNLEKLQAEIEKQKEKIKVEIDKNKIAKTNSKKNTKE